MAGPDEFARRVRESADRLSAQGVAALGGLFDLTSVRLVRFAAALTRHQQDAEDAVQTALVKLATQPHLLAAAACPWAYLLQMVRNEALLTARRKQRCTTPGDIGDLLTLCPVDEAEREESYRAIWSALRKLPPQQTEVVILKIWEGLTFAQIGQILETSANTVASRYQYAMEKLSKQLLSERRGVQS